MSKRKQKSWQGDKFGGTGRKAKEAKLLRVHQEKMDDVLTDFVQASPDGVIRGRCDSKTGVIHIDDYVEIKSSPVDMDFADLEARMAFHSDDLLDRYRQMFGNDFMFSGGASMHQEFGTHQHSQRPFFRETYDRASNPFDETVRRVAKEYRDRGYIYEGCWNVPPQHHNCRSSFEYQYQTQPSGQEVLDREASFPFPRFIAPDDLKELRARKAAAEDAPWRMAGETVLQGCTYPGN